MPRRTSITLAAATALLALAGCATDAPQDTWAPAGENAQRIHNLQWPIFAIAGVVLLIVSAVVVRASSRFSA